jgi:excisionase family DNA binding protein
MLTIEDLAEKLNVCTQTVTNWVKRGVIPPPIKLGRLIRWRAADLAHLL